MPEFEPTELKFPAIPAFQYDGTLAKEIESGSLSPQDAVDLLEWMLSVRAFEEMIVALRMQAFGPLREMGFQYRGPTHLSIGQEATSVGCTSAIRWTDYITSTHRGHGDAIAKGYVAVKNRTPEQLREWLGAEVAEGVADEELRGLAKSEHVYRTIAELFGKEDGYCRGRGGGMHIADFASGHLGANAIVGGSLGIATGAGLSCRYFPGGRLALCFAGDGAYSNGIVLESLNFASMAQFTNELADPPFGLPVIYVIVNNQYGMTGQQNGEVTGVECLARRAAGFAPDAMHAEVVNGMDVLAVRDSILRAAQLIRRGEGPVLREMVCYRYQGHSLSDPRNEYRAKEEEDAWRARDPVAAFSRQVIEAGVLDEDEVEKLRQEVEQRHEQAAIRAAKAPGPDVSEVCRYVFTDSFSKEAPAQFAHPATLCDPPLPERKEGQISFKEALREAIIEEMLRDERVVLYGEDVADYGGAFKVTRGLVETFGRRRVFNTAISEAAIVGSGVGAAMTGLRPIVELMYSDFEFQAGDQLFNQAAKWHYMSGGQTTVPMVIRSSVGAGKGYGGQHSQALEAHATHTPGMRVVCPSTPYDAKGLLKSAIRDDNPVLFIESQALYNLRAEVPQEGYLEPIGRAAVRRRGGDVTIVAWSLMAHRMLAAAETLAAQHGIDAELIDLRSLIPLDMETVLQSVRKTGRCVVACQACKTGSFTAEVAARIQRQAFDYLDAPVARIGSADAISPQSEALEKAYLPFEQDIVQAALEVCYVAD
ncbi:MAG: dehydrogenase E1 component subunit alpha/beta [Planctomycetes bacterium]|nr:dehydrogenase E1 component subunit alpha/beta [Planctomycetota bacterium]